MRIAFDPASFDAGAEAGLSEEKTGGAAIVKKTARTPVRIVCTARQR